MRSIAHVTLGLALASAFGFAESAAFAQKKGSGGSGGTTAGYTIVDLPSPYHAADGNWSSTAATRMSHPDPATGTVYICGWYERWNVGGPCVWAVNGAQTVALSDLQGVIEATDVNSAGIVGGSVDGRPAVLLPGGGVVTLPTPGDLDGWVTGLNDPDENGVFHVVGSHAWLNPGDARASLWTVSTDGAVLSTQPLIDAQGVSPRAYDVNNAGVMAGLASVDGQTVPLVARFDGGGVLQIDYLPNPDPAAIQYWRDMQVDDAGDVVGYGAEPREDPPIGEYPRAVVWPVSSPVISLSTLTGGTSTEGHGIAAVNGVMQVAGSAWSSSVGWYASLYTQGKLSDLNRLAKGNQTWNLYDAEGVNSAGWICGRGRVGSAKTKQHHGYVLIPNSQ